MDPGSYKTAMATLIRPLRMPTLPKSVYAIKQGGSYFGTRFPNAYNDQLTHSYVVVFERCKHAMSVRELISQQRVGFVDRPDVDDSWEMCLQPCSHDMGDTMTVQHEFMRDLLPLGKENIHISVVQNIRRRNNTVKFEGEVIPPTYSLQEIGEHYDALLNKQ